MIRRGPEDVWRWSGGGRWSAARQGGERPWRLVPALVGGGMLEGRRSAGARRDSVAEKPRGGMIAGMEDAKG